MRARHWSPSTSTANVYVIGERVTVITVAERILVEQKLAKSGDSIVCVVGTDVDPDAATSARIVELR